MLIIDILVKVFHNIHYKKKLKIYMAIKYFFKNRSIMNYLSFVYSLFYFYIIFIIFCSKIDFYF